MDSELCDTIEKKRDDEPVVSIFRRKDKEGLCATEDTVVYRDGGTASTEDNVDYMHDDCRTYDRSIEREGRGRRRHPQRFAGDTARAGPTILRRGESAVADAAGDGRGGRRRANGI